FANQVLKQASKPANCLKTSIISQGRFSLALADRPGSLMPAAKLLLLFVLALSLSACASTLPPINEADLDKAKQTHVQLGLGYLRAGNRDSARQNFNKALEIDRRSPGALEGMALLYQLEAMDELAEEHFRKAIRADRNFSRARNNYGSFLYEQGRFEEAYEQFERAAANLEYDGRPFALVNLGRTALKLGYVDRAESAL